MWIIMFFLGVILTALITYAIRIERTLENARDIIALPMQKSADMTLVVIERLERFLDIIPQLLHHLPIVDQASQLLYRIQEWYRIQWAEESESKVLKVACVYGFLPSSIGAWYCTLSESLTFQDQNARQIWESIRYRRPAALLTACRSLIDRHQENLYSIEEEKDFWYDIDRIKEVGDIVSDDVFTALERRRASSERVIASAHSLIELITSDKADELLILKKLTTVASVSNQAYEINYSYQESLE